MEVIGLGQDELERELKVARKEIGTLKKMLGIEDVPSFFSGENSVPELITNISQVAENEIIFWECNVSSRSMVFFGKPIGWNQFLTDRISFHTELQILIHPEDVDNFQNKWTSFLSGVENYFDSSFRLADKNGKFQWFWDTARTIHKDENGNPLLVIGNLILLDNELKETHSLTNGNFLRMFLKHSSVMLLIEPQNGKIVHANEAALKFYKYSKKDMRKLTMDDINAMDHKDTALERQKAIRGEKSQFIFSHRLANGTVRQVEVNSTLIPFENKQLLFSVIEDITDKLRMEEELRISEQALRKAEELGKFGNWQFNLKNKFFTASKGARLIYGLNDKKISFQEVRSKALDQYKPLLSKAMEDLVERNIPYDVEYKIQRDTDGQIIDIHSIAAYDQELKSLFGTIHDITDRKRIADALLESEEKFRLIIENTSEAILFLDFEGNVHFANPEACRLYQYSKEELVLKRREDLFDMEDCRYMAALDLYNSSGKFKGELIGRKKDGSFFPVEVIVNSSMDSKGNVKVSIIINDITHRKQVEVALKESERKYRALVNNSLVGIFRYQTSGNIMYINPAFVDMMEYGSSDELLVKNSLFKFRNEDEKEIYLELLEQENRVDNMELVLITGLGNERTFLISAIRYEHIIDGTIIHISDRKQAELLILKQNEELSKLNEDKDRFLSILAHDLKSPFNGLINFTELLQTNIRIYDIETIEQQLQMISKSANQIYLLLEDLLLWARSHSGKLRFRPKQILFSEVFEEVMNLLSSAIQSKEIKVVNQVTDGLTVFADMDMFKTILRNILSNAIKYSYPKGKIEIFAIYTSSRTFISISDNGVGMSKDIREKLFDYSRIYSTLGTAGEKGTGFGLLLCLEFVERHGGKIWVDNNPGQGCVFKFTLPDVNK